MLQFYFENVPKFTIIHPCFTNFFTEKNLWLFFSIFQFKFKVSIKDIRTKWNWRRVINLLRMCLEEKNFKRIFLWFLDAVSIGLHVLKCHWRASVSKTKWLKLKMRYYNIYTCKWNEWTNESMNESINRWIKEAKYCN